MAKKTKVGLKVPTANEMAKKYGSMIKLASEVWSMFYRRLWSCIGKR